MKLGISAVEAYKFVWNSDSTVKMLVEAENWGKNLPDNGHKGCVAFENKNSYRLNNFDCYSSASFFCEYLKT
jgi:hypothetical protein